MKRIQITITNKPRTDGNATFPDFITDCYHTGLYEQSCGEAIFLDPLERIVFYGEDESHIVSLINENNLYDEAVEIIVTEVPDGYWQELKTAMDNYDGDAAFCTALRAKYF